MSALYSHKNKISFSAQKTITDQHRYESLDQYQCCCYGRKLTFYIFHFDKFGKEKNLQKQDKIKINIGCLCRLSFIYRTDTDVSADITCFPIRHISHTPHRFMTMIFKLILNPERLRLLKKSI